MERNEAVVLNACCINKLTVDMMKKFDNEFKMMVAVNDKDVKQSAERFDILIDNIYRLLEKENYKRALLFVCLLEREMRRSGL